MDKSSLQIIIKTRMAEGGSIAPDAIKNSLDARTPHFQHMVKTVHLSPIMIGISVAAAHASLLNKAMVPRFTWPGKDLSNEQ